MFSELIKFRELIKCRELIKFNEFDKRPLERDVWV